METFEADPRTLQPSQLYVCSDKLTAIEQVRASGQNIPWGPLPVKRLGSRMVLTDGHTRALAAFRRGDDLVPVCWETDELDWEAYEICIQWCLEEGVHSVTDLDLRVVTAAQYEDLWYERCRVMRDQLDRQRRPRDSMRKT